MITLYGTSVTLTVISNSLPTCLSAASIRSTYKEQTQQECKSTIRLLVFLVILHFLLVGSSSINNYNPVSLYNYWNYARYPPITRDISFQFPMARISIYGATGYTGQLVAAEALRRGVDVVLLGRDKDALAKIPGAKETKAVGLDDISSLTAAFEGSNVVLSCVAPFSQLGSAVLEAAIQAKTHYVDISGDVNWVKRVHDEFGPKAKAAGVILLPA